MGDGHGAAPDPRVGDADAPVDAAGQARGGAGAPVGPAVAVPPRPRWLRVGALRISYVDVGDGPVVLLLHGLGHSIHGWRKNVAPLATAGYRVMAVDLPGFGYSDKPDELSLPLYVDFVRAWLDLHCVERATLVGNSLGGLIAAGVAAAIPERIGAAVLVDPAGFAREQPWLFRLVALTPARLLVPKRMPPWRIRRALRFVYHDRSKIEDDEVARIAELAALPGAREAFVRLSRRAATLGGMAPALGLGELPERISVPTLILWGRQDRLVPVSHAKVVCERCLDVEVTVFENCGHSPQMEAPDAFNARLLRFLGERGAPPG